VITSDLIGQKINCIMMSGEKRQGKLLSVDEPNDEFVINWKRSKDDDYFFRTTLRLSRVESLTELIRPENDGQAQQEKSNATGN